MVALSFTPWASSKDADKIAGMLGFAPDETAKAYEARCVKRGFTVLDVLSALASMTTRECMLEIARRLDGVVQVGDVDKIILKNRETTPLLKELAEHGFKATCRNRSGKKATMKQIDQNWTIFEACFPDLAGPLYFQFVKVSDEGQKIMASQFTSLCAKFGGLEAAIGGVAGQVAGVSDQVTAVDAKVDHANATLAGVSVGVNDANDTLSHVKHDVSKSSRKLDKNGVSLEKNGESLAYLREQIDRLQEMVERKAAAPAPAPAAPVSTSGTPPASPGPRSFPLSQLGAAGFPNLTQVRTYDGFAERAFGGAQRGGGARLAEFRARIAEVGGYDGGAERGGGPAVGGYDGYDGFAKRAFGGAERGAWNEFGCDSAEIGFGFEYGLEEFALVGLDSPERQVPDETKDEAKAPPPSEAPRGDRALQDVKVKLNGELRAVKMVRIEQPKGEVNTLKPGRLPKPSMARIIQEQKVVDAREQEQKVVDARKLATFGRTPKRSYRAL